MYATGLWGAAVHASFNSWPFLSQTSSNPNGLVIVLIMNEQSVKVLGPLCCLIERGKIISLMNARCSLPRILRLHGFLIASTSEGWSLVHGTRLITCCTHTNDRPERANHLLTPFVQGFYSMMPFHFPLSEPALPSTKLLAAEPNAALPRVDWSYNGLSAISSPTKATTLVHSQRIVCGQWRKT